MTRVRTPEEEELRRLVIEIAQHFDPMYGYINLRRLDDRKWMKEAREALGEETWLEMFSWWKK